MPVKPQPPEIRFDRHVDMSGDCWLWIGSTKPNGYGEFVVTTQPKRVKAYAHRYAFERAFGPIPEGKEVCHSCDTRNCVRPSHLFAGTRSDNMRDASEKGRIRNHVGACAPRRAA